MFLAEVVAYAQRVDLSVGIVAMMDRNSTGVDFPVSIHVQQMLQNGWSEVLNPCGGKRFSLLHTGLPCPPHSFLYYGYRGYFPGANAARPWC